MNYLWAVMILIGMVFSAFFGTLPDVTQAALDCAKEAVSLCIAMTGVMAFWTGLMRIAQESGMTAGLSNGLKPFLHFLFPTLPKDHEANDYLAANIIANIFGLGWAATPAGLKAMESLEKLKEERKEVEKDTASIEMCTFLILNISSLQLIPVNIIAYRSQYGSVNPTEIIGPAVLATSISTFFAVLFCKSVPFFRKN